MSFASAVSDSAPFCTVPSRLRLARAKNTEPSPWGRRILVTAIVALTSMGVGPRAFAAQHLALVNTSVHYAPGASGSVSGSQSTNSVANPMAASKEAPANSTQPLKLITITGSRIPTLSYTGTQPLVRVSKAQLLATGAPTLAAALQQLPSVGASLTNSRFFGTGTETINLRNLGAERVLVLVNGHRWVTGLDGYADISNIPTAIVKRVVILQDGASAIYGSSAIAGVVNIITLKNFNGAEASAYYGIHNGDGHWDGHEQDYNITLGSATHRWGALVNIGFSQEGNIPDNHRAISSDPVYGTGHYFGNAFTPQGRFEFYVPAAYTMDPTSPTNAPNPAYTGLTSAQCPTVDHGGQYLPFCDLALIPGTPGTSASDFAPWNRKTDGFISTPYNNILTPYRKYNLYAQGYFRFNSHVRFHTTVFFNDRESNGSLGPQPLNIDRNGINANIAANNPYNPFGIPLDASGDASTNVVAIERALAEAGARIEGRHVYTYYVDSGLNGSFRLAGREFIWNSDYSNSR